MRRLNQYKEVGKIVLVRVDYNVPIKEGKITDDKRIKASVPTLKYLLKLKSKIVLVSHLGRPKGGFAEEFSLKPVAERLNQLIKKDINFISYETSFEDARDIIENSKNQIFMIENIRFHKEEEENNEKFAKSLASVADFFVNDAFGTCHRAHASTEGVTRYLKSYAGLLVEEEVTQLSKALKPKKPLIVVLGGVKVSDKIGVIKNFLGKARYILIGGAMSFTFLKAEGYDVGNSIIEKNKITLAKFLLKKGKGKIVLPVDVITAKKIDKNEAASTYTIDSIPSDEMGLDIGPASIKLFKNYIAKGKTIVWNGSMGVNEIPQFAEGTAEIAKALAKSSATTIIGGGDTVGAINKLKLESKMTHVSTGGGASLEFLEGKTLPAIKPLLK